MAEALSIIGTIVLIVIGVLIITLLAYAIRILILIYSFFGSRVKKGGLQAEEATGGKLGKFIKGASVIEIILFLLRNRGRFRR
jgi:uncharacterized membrane protein